MYSAGADANPNTNQPVSLANHVTALYLTDRAVQNCAEMAEILFFSHFAHFCILHIYCFMCEIIDVFICVFIY